MKPTKSIAVGTAVYVRGFGAEVLDIVRPATDQELAKKSGIKRRYFPHYICQDQWGAHWIVPLIHMSTESLVVATGTNDRKRLHLPL